MPVLTTIGSPNFGHRSVYRDLEMQLFVVTENLQLRGSLQQELRDMLQHCGGDSGGSVCEKPAWLQSAAARLAARCCRGFF